MHALRPLLKGRRPSAVPGLRGRRTKPLEVESAESPSTSESVRLLRTLVRWQIRIGMLWLRRRASRTVQAWGLLVLLAIAAPTLPALAATGAWPVPSELGAPGRAGALLVGHLALMLCFLAMLPAVLLRDVVLRADRDPLRAHPWVLPELQLSRIAGGILWTAAFLTGFFQLFHLPLLAADDGRWWPMLPLHAIVGVAHLFSVGTVGVLLMRRRLLSLPPGRQGEGRHRLLILPFIMTFPLFALLPGAMGDFTPNLLVRMGSIAGSSGWLLQTPAAVSHLANVGKLTGASLWSFAGVGVALVSGLHLWWRRTHFSTPEVGADPGPARRFARGFERPPVGPSWIRDFLLFREKDVVLPARRTSWYHLREQGPVLVWLSLGAIGLREVLAAGRLEPSSVWTLTGTVPVALAALHGLRRSLPGLGMEGDRLSAFRPLLPMPRLFRAKLAVSLSGVVPLAAVQALALSVVGTLAGIPVPPPVAALLMGTGAALVLAYAGTAVGFLLPDPERRSPFHPGASLSGRTLYGSLCGLVILGQGTALALGGAPQLSPRRALAIGLAPILLSALASILMMVTAFRRFERGGS